MSVGYLSGIYSPKYSELGEPYRCGPKQKTYWHRSELGQLTDTSRRLDGRLDVLLTHDWPSGVGTNRWGKPVGDPALRQLTQTIQPRVHACGHMHHDHRATIGDTQVICLAKPHNSPTGLRGVTSIERHTDGSLQILN